MTQKKINLNNFKFKINSNEWDSKYYEKNNEEFFVASDASPFIEYTKDAIYLEDGELAIIKKDKGIK